MTSLLQKGLAPYGLNVRVLALEGLIVVTLAAHAQPKTPARPQRHVQPRAQRSGGGGEPEPIDEIPSLNPSSAKAGEDADRVKAQIDAVLADGIGA